jgi:hypothetical protein
LWRESDGRWRGIGVHLLPWGVKQVEEETREGEEEEEEEEEEAEEKRNEIEIGPNESN